MRKFYVLKLNNNIKALFNGHEYNNSIINLGDGFEEEMFQRKNGLPFGSVLAEEIHGKMILLLTGDEVVYVPRNEEMALEDDYVEVKCDSLSYYEAKEVCESIVCATLSLYKNAYEVERFIMGINDIKNRNFSLYGATINLDSPLCEVDEVKNTLEYVDKFSVRAKKLSRVMQQVNEISY